VFHIQHNLFIIQNGGDMFLLLKVRSKALLMVKLVILRCDYGSETRP